MIRRSDLIFLLLISCMFIACKKEEMHPQGIIPKAYFPAFPGSRWTYVTDEGEFVTYSTAAEYARDEFEKDGEIYRGIVPVYEGKFVWGYSFRSGNAAPVLFLKDDKPVGSIIQQHNGQGSITATRIIARDTTVNVNGVDHYPTIIVESGWYFPMTIPWSRSYYTKDIGLVKVEKFDNMGAINETLSLVSHHINR